MNSSDLDTAILNRLQADATLHGLLPDGVYFDEAPPGSTRFVLVGILASDDTGVFGGRAIETVTYFVKATALSTAGANLNAAADRIDDLLSDPPGGFSVTGYEYMACYRYEDEPRIRRKEVDQIDASIRWDYRGGHYTLEAAVL